MTIPVTWEICIVWLNRVHCDAMLMAASEHFQHLKYCVSIFESSVDIYWPPQFVAVNPLGSKTAIHKLGAFYFVFKNFSPAVNSSLQNIHLLALAHAADLKNHSVDSVMKVVVEELTKLHDHGFYSHDDKMHYNVYLTQVVGDNLGLHAMLSFAEIFNRARHCCDLCMATQDEIQTVFREDQLTLRDNAAYDSRVSGISSGLLTTSECGIKRPSALSSLP